MALAGASEVGLVAKGTLTILDMPDLFHPGTIPSIPLTPHLCLLFLTSYSLPYTPVLSTTPTNPTLTPITSSSSIPFIFSSYLNRASFNPPLALPPDPGPAIGLAAICVIGICIVYKVTPLSPSLTSTPQTLRTLTSHPHFTTPLTPFHTMLYPTLTHPPTHSP